MGTFFPLFLAVSYQGQTTPFVSSFWLPCSSALFDACCSHLCCMSHPWHCLLGRTSSTTKKFGILRHFDMPALGKFLFIHQLFYIFMQGHVVLSMIVFMSKVQLFFFFTSTLHLVVFGVTDLAGAWESDRGKPHGKNLTGCKVWTNIPTGFMRESRFDMSFSSFFLNTND